MTDNGLPNFTALVEAAYLRCHALHGDLETLGQQLPADVAPLAPHREALAQALEVVGNAREALAAPRLHLAFVGTTKAGKSTMVNGFIGRRLAPMESEEMSAGLLQLVEGLLGARAERGSLALSDHPSEEEIYEGLKRSMGRVVAERHAERVGEPVRPQPVYEVTAPLFPNMEQHDFHAFTSGRIPVKVFDLPGLRTVNDGENFGVIHAHLGTALSIVVIDRNQLANRETQAAILNQLSEVVADLGGRTTLMLFLLNKSDSRNTDDQPLEEEARKVEAMIRRRLSLENDPHAVAVVPVSGLLYYWGARLLVALAEHRNVDAQAMRENILTDGWRGLGLYFKAEKTELRKVRNTLEENLEDGVDTELDILLDVGTRLLTAAGHDVLWHGIKQRVDREASTVLVYPHVSKALRLDPRLSDAHQGLRRCTAD